jgi:predicted TPR repeat methyltransferase
MQVVQTALRIDPALGAANYQMGALLEQAGNDAAAIEHYRKAVIAEPDAIPPRVLLANALLRGRQFRQAAAHYERLLKALPDDVLVRYRAGLANLGAGKCDAAIQHLRHAFENLTGNATLLEAMVRAVATCPSSSPADRQAALVYGQKLFDKLQRPDTGATLAMTLAALKRFPEAIALQKKVLQAAQGAKLPAAIMHAFEKNLALYEANQAAASAFETDEPVFNVPRVDSRQRLAMARGKPATQ